MSSSGSANGPGPVLRTRTGAVYTPAVGPRLRILLHAIFAGFALLSATGVYLFSVRAQDWVFGGQHTTQFTLWMFLVHLLLGVAMVLPFFAFGIMHLVTARTRPNRRAVKLGIVLFIAGTLIVVSGVALLRLDGFPQLPTSTTAYGFVYGLHVLAPVAAVVLYVMHRRAGPLIRWRWGIGWGVAVGGIIVAMAMLHTHDPRRWHLRFSSEGEYYFEPSKARTAGLKYIPAQAMMMEEYCRKCHADIYDDHIHSAHKFSSFNNPAYLFSVMETRRVRGVRASRFCAGCHDPVPFFSGAFDDPDFDVKNHPTAKAGITCTVCHSITHVNSRSGNGDYIIEEPLHYPFAYSENPILQWINNQLVKARPDFHKKTFMKPLLHRGKERFCSACHNVFLPMEVSHYKEFLQGQNINDSYHASGVSGMGARSFYYPPAAKRCADCHMPLKESEDFGARDFDGTGRRTVHNHQFLGANTGVLGLLWHRTKDAQKKRALQKAIEAHRDFLQKGIDGKSPTMRIEIFGLKHLPTADTGVEAPLLDDRPLRPHLPKLRPGQTYLIEIVIRTLNVGHHFTQGTVDSNEVWVDVAAWSGNRLLARSGALDGGEDRGRLDPEAHRLNVLVLDRYGNRIDRRNAQDIFTPLYDYQIPPGAAQVVHYRFRVPKEIDGPVKLTARVRYRKFDYAYMEYVHGKGKVPQLPIVDLCRDEVILPVAGVAEDVPPQESPIKPYWQRWNDYGIGCFLEGSFLERGPTTGRKSPELGQAEKAFERLVGPEFEDSREARAHGWLNLARVYYAYGSQLEKRRGEKPYLLRAAEALEKALHYGAPWWTVAWFSGQVNMELPDVDQAIRNFQTILDPKYQPRKRRFDFSRDWVVRNALGKAYYARALQEMEPESRRKYLAKAVEQFEQVLPLDAENQTAHDFLHRCYERLAAGIDSRPGANREPGGDLEPIVTRLVDETLDEPARLAAARQITQRLRSDERFDSLALVEIRDQLHRSANTTASIWVRTALTPIIRAIDRRLLDELPRLTDRFVEDSRGEAERTRAAAEIATILQTLAREPRREDLHPVLRSSACLPHTGLPVNLALAAMAHRSRLDGPLPPARLIKLLAIREKIRPVYEQGDALMRRAAASVLAATHALLHEIYRPDEQAEGRAKRIYRSRHPEADRASNPPAIYDLR